MHILVIGGTGPSGLAFVSEALQASHRLTLFARNPNKFPQDLMSNPDVAIVKGEFTDMVAVKQALSKGAEVLVSFAGPMGGRGMPITEFYERLFPLLPNESAIRRCMILSTASYSVREDKTSFKWWIVVCIIWLLAGSAYAEINGISKATASLPSDKVEWTLFRVPILTKSEAKPVRASFLGDGTDGLLLSRQSAAVWILQELHERKWIGGAPSLSNPGWI